MRWTRVTLWPILTQTTLTRCGVGPVSNWTPDWLLKCRWTSCPQGGRWRGRWWRPAPWRSSPSSGWPWRPLRRAAEPVSYQGSAGWQWEVERREILLIVLELCRRSSGGILLGQSGDTGPVLFYYISGFMAWLRKIITMDVPGLQNNVNLSEFNLTI